MNLNQIWLLYEALEIQESRGGKGVGGWKQAYKQKRKIVIVIRSNIYTKNAAPLKQHKELNIKAFTHTAGVGVGNDQDKLYLEKRDQHASFKVCGRNATELGTPQRIGTLLNQLLLMELYTSLQSCTELFIKTEHKRK